MALDLPLPPPPCPCPHRTHLSSPLVSPFPHHPPSLLRCALRPPGPCSKTRVTIDVYVEEDFKLRLKYRRGRTVILLLRRNIRLRAGLVLGPAYACTMIRRPDNTSNLQLHYPA